MTPKVGMKQTVAAEVLAAVESAKSPLKASEVAALTGRSATNVRAWLDIWVARGRLRAWGSPRRYWSEFAVKG